LTTLATVKSEMVSFPTAKASAAACWSYRGISQFKN
jgi:hypothetical protein